MVIPMLYLLVLALIYVQSTHTAGTDEKRTPFRPPALQPVKPGECPTSCREVFRKLQCGADCEDGVWQNVDVQQRGEPKSGTGFMYEWATSAIAHACTYLTRAYGEGSCWIEWDFKNRTLIFDPALGTSGAAVCPCEDFKRATITLINKAKHTLPVPYDCGYFRGGGIAKASDRVCHPPNSTAPLENHVGLWDCVRKSKCRDVDNRLQMAILRDPRPMVVSAYFHQLENAPSYVQGVSVDEFVLLMLPILCKWLSVRYLLFADLLAAKSAIFWYDEALADPIGWHESFFSFVGLKLPQDIVRKAAKAASDGGKIFGLFPSKGMDKHQGGADADEGRTFRDEVNSTTLSSIDDVLRVWLPPVVLEKLDVKPE